MKKFIFVVMFILVVMSMLGCVEQKASSDDVQHAQQETILREATQQTGMPAIKNFRERKIMKEILEKRDQSGFITYTYMKSEINNDLKLLCKSIGYPIPYSTQYTNPQKIEERTGTGYAILPQADPNSLFSPSSANATWSMCINPNDSKDVQAVYSESNLTTSPFPLK